LIHKTFLLFITLLLISACQPAPTPAADLPAPAVQIVRPTGAPSAAPSPTSLPSPTPQRGIIYPYTIAGLRERDYSAGEIQVGAPLAVTDFYTRYSISYPSDGLNITGILQVPPGDGPFPVILLNHGYYNRAEYRSGDGTDRIAEVLNFGRYCLPGSFQTSKYR